MVAAFFGPAGDSSVNGLYIGIMPIRVMLSGPRVPTFDGLIVCYCGSESLVGSPFRGWVPSGGRLWGRVVPEAWAFPGSKFGGKMSILELQRLMNLSMPGEYLPVFPSDFSLYIWRGRLICSRQGVLSIVR